MCDGGYVVRTGSCTDIVVAVVNRWVSVDSVLGMWMGVAAKVDVHGSGVVRAVFVSHVVGVWDPPAV